ncbi:ABC transporter substrate-binding protein [Aquibacillus albus]|uniref:Multiple sugar transport system substrate-binding protein n=1 Tax=Aquibacillus albus TaxID=1168171 RepID=A0ABS2MWH4_9BACI|nr:sugar ABC transporter substrate-binding protein [Aquibacillus albus]MBM7570205.1 multiple sugar transport system substrate-binding protein [Aquibacillus albus]
MNKKHFWMGLLLALVMLVVTACGDDEEQANGNENSGENAGESSGESEEEQVEIRFTWWGDTARHEIYNEIADRFEEQNPNITVKREFGGWTDYWDKLTTQTAGGNAPDIVGMHQFYVSDYARRGALLSLNDLVDSGNLDLSKFPQSVVDSGKIGEDIIMVAQGITMSGYAYNTALFDELGIEYPDHNWTYQDLEDISRQVNEATNGEVYGTSDMSGGQLQPNFRYFVRQKGKDLFTEDGQIGFEKEDLVEWWAMWKEWREDGLIPDGATQTEFEGAPLEQNLFTTGQSALYQIPANQIHLYQEQFDEGEIQMVRIPSLQGGESGEFIEGAYLSITKDSEHPEEAAKFIDFFVNTKDSLEVFKVEQGAPGNSEMSEFVKPLLEPAQTRAVEFIENTVDNARPAPYSPKGVSELEQVFSDNATAVQFNEMTVEEAAEDFFDQAESILK